MTSGSHAKALRREDKAEITVLLDKETAVWLFGFFTALLGTMTLENVNSDTLNARTVVKATQEGLDEQAKSNSPTTE